MLEARREERIERTARRLLEGEDVQELLPELQQIDAYSRLLATTGPKHRERKWVWPAVVVLVCVTVAGILWSLKVPRTNISMMVDSDSLAATLRSPWRAENVFHSSLMHVERVSTINAPNLGLAIEQHAGDAWFELKGGDIGLEMVEIERNASVEIHTDQDEIDLFASRARLRGRITVTGKVTVKAGPRVGETTVDGSHDISVPETIEFSVDVPQSIPARLSVHSPGAWSLGHLEVTQLGFSHEELQGAGERSVTSGIKGGTVRFDDSSRPVMELREGDFIRARLTESSVLTARGANGVIHATVNGIVSGIGVGNAKRAANLAPTYLEYLYNKKSLGLFWGAIVFLWGVIWGLRNAVLR
ncbi:MAG: hypothetical protein AABO58_19000 [Acidobacteriota bacterium]